MFTCVRRGSPVKKYPTHHLLVQVPALLGKTLKVCYNNIHAQYMEASKGHSGEDIFVGDGAEDKGNEGLRLQGILIFTEGRKRPTRGP